MIESYGIENSYLMALLSVGVINKVILKETKHVPIWIYPISVPVMYILMKILVKDMFL